MSDEKFKFAMTLKDFNKLLPQLNDFIPKYINDLQGFRDYYEAIKAKIKKTDFEITDSNKSETYDGDKVFDHLYGDLSPLFQEYLVEAYILGVPLIYCMEISGKKYFNYSLDSEFKPLYIKNDDNATITEPLVDENLKQTLYLSKNDYKYGNLKSIFISIRNLYEECVEVLSCNWPDHKPSTSTIPYTPNSTTGPSTDVVSSILTLESGIEIKTDSDGKVEFIFPDS